MSWDPAICEEVAPVAPNAQRYECDSGYRLTDRAKQERRKRRNAFLVVRAPQLQLDSELLPLVGNRNVSDPPRLHYGFVFPRAELDKIVARYHLTIGDGQPVTDDYDRKVYTRNAVAEYLQKKISDDLRIVAPFVAKQDVYVIALDDTQRLRCTKSKSWAKRAQHIFRKVRKVLRLPQSARPMWYWSSTHDERYLCALTKYNPPQVTYYP